MVRTSGVRQRAEDKSCPGAPRGELVPPHTWDGLIWFPPNHLLRNIWDLFKKVIRFTITDIIEQDEIGIKHGKIKVNLDFDTTTDADGKKKLTKKGSYYNFGLDNYLHLKGKATIPVDECPKEEVLKKIESKAAKEWEDFIKAVNDAGPNMKVQTNKIKVECNKAKKELSATFDLEAD